MAVTQQRREEILAGLEAVEERIAAACQAAGRERSSVNLLPITKYHPVDDILVLHEFGHRRFGENLANELESKADALTGMGCDDVSWVFVGHLQSNKVRVVARHAVQFQALDSLRLAQLLDRRLRAEGRMLEVLIQVNSSGEASKFGLEPSQVVAFGEQLVSIDRLHPTGLMTLAVNSPDDTAVARCFDLVVELQSSLLGRQVAGAGWRDLSMGMSGDLELAIARGATCVRVGQAILGARPAG